MRKPSLPSGTPSPMNHLTNARSSKLRMSSSSLMSASTTGTPCCSRTAM
jgi:hypothetical protein